MDIDQQYVLPNDNVDMDVFSKKRKLKLIENEGIINGDFAETHQSVSKLMKTQLDQSCYDDDLSCQDATNIKNAVIIAKSRA